MAAVRGLFETSMAMKPAKTFVLSNLPPPLSLFHFHSEQLTILAYLRVRTTSPGDHTRGRGPPEPLALKRTRITRKAISRKEKERSTSMKSIYSSLVALVDSVGQVNSSARHSIQRGHAMKSTIFSLTRREFLSKAAATLCVIATLVIGPVATADDRGGWHWVASWATSPAAFFVYTAPVVQNQALAPAPARFATANIQP